MKWSLQQLFKLAQRPYSFKDVYDFHDRIANIDDILDISDINVEGVAQFLYDDRYEFNLHINGFLILQDARTLEPVNYPIDIETVEVFDKVINDDEDIRIVEKNTIDLSDVVWESILLEKPMRFVKNDE